MFGVRGEKSCFHCVFLDFIIILYWTLLLVFCYFVSVMMLLLVTVAMLLLVEPTECQGVPCGSPPLCQCYPEVGMVACMMGEALPAMTRTGKLIYRTLFLEGVLADLPDLSSWTGLRTLDLERATVSCSVVAQWRMRASFNIRASRCVNASG